MSNAETIMYKMDEGVDSLTPPSSPPPSHPLITLEEENPIPILKGIAPQEVVGGTSKRRGLTLTRKDWWSTFYRKVKSLRIVRYFMLFLLQISKYIYCENCHI